MKQIKVGIIGCGTIGSNLAIKIQKSKELPAKVCYIADLDKAKARLLKKKISPRKHKYSDCRISTIEELIKKSDFVIEAASASISFKVASSCLKNNKDVLVMSIGGLVKGIKTLKNLGKKSKGMLYLPSGALCGIDGILAASGSSIRSVSLTTRKPIAGLRGAPYFSHKKLDIDKIKKETVVFCGNAEEAIKYFPKNVNVAALLSLASLGIKRTKVKIVTSPHYTRNMHQVIAEGSFGRIQTITENVPSPTNPKTSYLAILAAEALLKKIFNRIKIGT